MFLCPLRVPRASVLCLRIDDQQNLLSGSAVLLFPLRLSAQWHCTELLLCWLLNSTPVWHSLPMGATACNHIAKEPDTSVFLWAAVLAVLAAGALCATVALRGSAQRASDLVAAGERRRGARWSRHARLQSARAYPEASSFLQQPLHSEPEPEQEGTVSFNGPGSFGSDKVFPDRQVFHSNAVFGSNNHFGELSHFKSGTHFEEGNTFSPGSSFGTDTHFGVCSFTPHWPLTHRWVRGGELLSAENYTTFCFVVVLFVFVVA